MMSKVVYVCEICGSEHKTEEAALVCECFHRHIADAVHYEEHYGRGCEHPAEIIVKFTDSKDEPPVIYRREGFVF